MSLVSFCRSHLSWIALTFVLSNLPLLAEDRSVDPFSVCFSEVLQTQVKDLNNDDERVAWLVASDHETVRRNSQTYNASLVAWEYGQGDYGSASAEEYIDSLKTLNQGHYSSDKVHDFMSKTLSPESNKTLVECMQLKTKLQLNQTSVWHQVTGDPKVVLVHITFSPQSGVGSATATIDHVSGAKCDKCRPKSLAGNTDGIFKVIREEEKTPISAIVNVLGKDYSVIVGGYEEPRLQRVASSLCSGDLPSILKVTSTRITLDANLDFSLSNVPNGYSQTFPAKTWRGIGWLVEPSQFPNPSNVNPFFVMHDHIYTSAHVPDSQRAFVIYQFSRPAEVSQIEVVQHTNGIRTLQTFLGDSEDQIDEPLGVSMSHFTALGTNVIPEGQTDLFVFPTTPPAPKGRFLKVVVAETTMPTGWATYRMIPRDKLGRRFLPHMTCLGGGTQIN